MNMKHVALDYFPEFKCLADKCNYTCCYQWQIDIKRPDYMKVKNLRASKETKEKIEHCFKRVRDDSTPYYAQMVMREDGYCPFLTEQKMCSLQQECGYNVLPEICKVFPRLKHLAPNTWEHSCSTGCEQTVNLLLKRPQGLRLIEIETKKKAYMDEKFLEQKLEKRPVFHYYKEIQMLFMGILQNRKYSLPHRMLLIGLAARDLDNVTTQQEALEFLQKSISLLQYDENMERHLNQLKKNEVIGIEEALKPTLRVAILHKNQPHPDQYFLKVIDDISKNLEIKKSYKENLMEVNVRLNVDRYLSADEHFSKLEVSSYLLENLMLNMMMQMQFPLNWRDNYEDKTIWDSYIDFCIRYNIFKVLIVSYMSDKDGMEDIAHIVTVCSRSLIHNTTLRENVRTEWKKRGLDTLAHIAYLLCF